MSRLYSDMRFIADGGESVDGTDRREGSRLEVDDPHHCKNCGTRLPEICVEDEWHPLGGDEPPEYCGSCLAEAMLA